MDWIVYYEDGSTFTSDDGKPEDAPRRGAMIVANRDRECGKILSWNEESGTQAPLQYSDADFFVWRKGQWLPVDQFGMLDYLLEPGAYKVVLWGRMSTREQMHKVYLQAFHDKRMHEKSGYIQGRDGVLY